MSVVGPNGNFSLPGFFIVLRETLEAAIIVSVLLSVLKKTGNTNLNRYVWFGIGSGILFTLAVLAITVFAFLRASNALIENAGDGEATQEDIEEAQRIAGLKLKMVLSFSAAVMIAGMCWSLDGILKKQKEIEAEMEKEAAGTESNKKVVTWKSMFFLSFTTVAREGVETVIFLGVGSGFSPRALYWPIVSGFLSGCLAGILIYKASSKVAVVWFFRLSTVLLTFIGAGIFAHGFEELFRITGPTLGFWTEIVYNISSWGSLNNEWFQLFRAMFGYTPYPTYMEFIGYLGYHVIIISGFMIKWQFEKRNLSPMKSLKNKILGRKVEESNNADASEDTKDIKLEEGTVEVKAVTDAENTAELEKTEKLVVKELEQENVVRAKPISDEVNEEVPATVDEPEVVEKADKVDEEEEAVVKTVEVSEKSELEDKPTVEATKKPEVEDEAPPVIKNTFDDTFPTI